MRNRLNTRTSLLNSGLASVLVGAGFFLALAPSALAQNEVVVVTGTSFNTEAAPAKSSLDAMQPKTIIDHKYVEDSIAETADYTTTLAIAPSLTGTDINGPGLSDGGVKNTMRGLPDGMYGMTYDGIPFGDTNGPSHHSESYFPSTTIGSIDVERGPGNAGNLGAATFGGSINMFSEQLRDDPRLKMGVTYGSWQTTNFNLNLQSGNIDAIGVNTRVLVNIQDTNSEGYLSYQTTAHDNELLKIQTDLAPGWTLTMFANRNGLHQTLNDSNGATAAQILAYGKEFALELDNPKSGAYAPYNPEKKQTDMDYLRLQGEVGNGFTVDDTAYTYAYVNRTNSATAATQTNADIAAGISENVGTWVGGTNFKTDVQGYTKQNAFRVWGNIFRMGQEFDFGWLTGQARAGVWWESSATQRTRNDYDATKCLAINCDPWHDTSVVDTSQTAAHLAKPKAVVLANGLATEYVEHSNWSQYQPFVELELHPFDGLTFTPGFKYVNWDRTVAAPLEQKTSPPVPFSGGYTTTRSLPFAMANYRILPNWSVYGQYAQGIYVPDISTFEQSVPTSVFPKAETTTNYQLGSVFYSDNFTVDGDLYYIGVDNNYVSQKCNVAPFTGSSSETCFINSGTAVYSGAEGEATYAFGMDDFGGALDGLSIFANGSVSRAKSAGLWIKQAPMWTAAGGLMYKTGFFKMSVIDKAVGQQYSDKTLVTSSFYKIPAYNNMDFKASFDVDRWEFAVGVYNVLNARSLVQIAQNDSTPIGGANARDLINRGSSLDQYYFMPSRSVQMTVKATF